MNDQPKSTSDIPEPLRKQLSEAGKKGIKQLSISARSRGGKKAMRSVTHEERVRRGQKAWQARLDKARKMAEKLAQEAAPK